MQYTVIDALAYRITELNAALAERDAEAVEREAHLQQLEDTYQRTVEELTIELRQLRNEVTDLKRVVAANGRLAREDQQPEQQRPAATRPATGSLVWPAPANKPKPEAETTANGKTVTLADLITGKAELLSEEQLTEIDAKVHADVHRAMQDRADDPFKALYDKLDDPEFLATVRAKFGGRARPGGLAGVHPNATARKQ